MNTHMVEAQNVQVGDEIITTVTNGIETAVVAETRTGWAGIGREVRTFLTIDGRERPIRVNPTYLVAVVDRY